MQKPAFNENWPESWKSSYPYDLEEVFNEIHCRGYAYAYANRRLHTLELVQKAAKPPATVLDIAAAQGNFSLTLAEAGYLVTWNDLREDLADYVRLKHDGGEIRYAPGNAFELGFQSQFDVVVITEIIEHVAHPDVFLKKVGELVKPGGHVVMTTPNGGYFLNRLPKFSECSNPEQFEAVQFKPNSDGHIFLLHQDELPALASAANLDIKEIRLYTNSLTNGHLKTEHLLKVTPRKLVQKIDSLTAGLPKYFSQKLHTSMAVLFERQI